MAANKKNKSKSKNKSKNKDNDVGKSMKRDLKEDLTKSEEENEALESKKGSMEIPGSMAPNTKNESTSKSKNKDKDAEKSVKRGLKENLKKLEEENEALESKKGSMEIPGSMAPNTKNESTSKNKNKDKDAEKSVKRGLKENLTKLEEENEALESKKGSMEIPGSMAPNTKNESTSKSKNKKVEKSVKRGLKENLKKLEEENEALVSKIWSMEMLGDEVKKKTDQLMKVKKNPVERNKSSPGYTLSEWGLRMLHAEKDFWRKQIKYAAADNINMKSLNRDINLDKKRINDEYTRLAKLLDPKNAFAAWKDMYDSLEKDKLAVDRTLDLNQCKTEQVDESIKGMKKFNELFQKLGTINKEEAAAATDEFENVEDTLKNLAANIMQSYGIVYGLKANVIDRKDDDGQATSSGSRKTRSEEFAWKEVVWVKQASKV